MPKESIKSKPKEPSFNTQKSINIKRSKKHQSLISDKNQNKNNGVDNSVETKILNQSQISKFNVKGYSSKTSYEVPMNI